MRRRLSPATSCGLIGIRDEITMASKSKKSRAKKTRSPTSKATINVEQHYSVLAPRAEALRVALSTELGTILSRANIALAIPIESRVKSLTSIQEKIERVGLKLTTLTELHDLVGIRIILQFRRDVATVCDVIEQHLAVVQRYDTADRLMEDQFGYASVHFIAQLKPEWLAVPTFAPLGDLFVEIQVRTTAQHIWAAASHVLQYRQEASVPLELRRSIYRVSALLETVDLEFERVLTERDSYREALERKPAGSDEPLNVDILERTLNELLPPQNRAGTEDYARLLEELLLAEIDTSAKLIDFYEKSRDYIALREARRVAESKKEVEGGEVPRGTSVDRVNRGVFFNHAGLIRIALRNAGLLEE